MLIAWEACSNVDGPVGFEDIEEGRRCQRKLAGLEFETAGFGDRDSHRLWRRESLPREARPVTAEAHLLCRTDGPRWSLARAKIRKSAF
jgi:hypothetical protein